MNVTEAVDSPSAHIPPLTHHTSATLNSFPLFSLSIALCLSLYAFLTYTFYPSHALSLKPTVIRQMFLLTSPAPFSLILLKTTEGGRGKKNRNIFLSLH